MNNPQLTPARIAASALVLAAAFIAGRYSATDTNEVPHNLNITDNTPALSEKPTLDLLLDSDDTEAIEETHSSYAELSESSEILRLNSAQDVEALREKLIEWAKTDPLAALAFASSQIEPLFDSQQAVIAILHQWAAIDPAQAWQWTWENAPNNTAGIITAIARVDPGMAWENAGLFAEVNPELPHLGYSCAIEGMLDAGDHPSLLDLVEEADIPSPNKESNICYRFIEQIVANWVLYSPEEAAVWVESLPEASERKSNAQQALLITWITTDPIPALEYAKTRPLGKGEYEATLQMGLETLFNKDMGQAQQWLNQQEELGPDFDWPIVSMVTKPSLLNQDVHNAIAWAKTIKHPDLRDEAFSGIAAHWLVRDTEEAVKYFEENPQLLSEEGLYRAEGNAHREITRMNTVPSYNGLN